MRLVSCYIENFGGLSGFSMEFDPGLTVIRQPNGFGKTTLAEFIRAMLYGFPRKTPKQMGRRQKYAPWNGGKCGGHLTFEYEGKQYRIERTFGATPRGDTFSLIDLETGRRSSRFPEEVGLAVFGLDADSFERSTYLPQSREAGPMTTDSIRAKLSGLVEDTADVGSYEKAMQALRTRRAALIPYRGSGGTVAEDRARITRLQQELDGALESEARLRQTAGELEGLRREQTRGAGQIDSLRRELTAANEAAARLAHRQHHDRLQAALALAEEERQALAEKYPLGMPEPEDLDAVNDAVEAAARLAAEPETAEERSARRFMEAHAARFAGGTPDAGEFDRLEKTWDLRRTAEARLESCGIPEEETAELGELEEFFAPGVPEAEAVEAYGRDMAEAARLRQENLRLAARTVQTVPCKVPSPLTLPLLLCFGILAVLAGMAMLLGQDRGAGAAALGLGAALLLGAAWVNRRRSMTREVAALSPQVQALIRENEEQAAALEASARSFGRTYGHTGPEELRRRMARLAALRERQQAMAGSRWELNARVAEYDAALDAFFARYHYRPEGDACEGLNRFRRICESWERAGEILRAREERQARHSREAEKIRAAVEAFREKYGTAPRDRDQVLAIREDVRRAAELAARSADLEDRIAACRRDYGDALKAPAPEQGADPAALARREAELLERQDRIGRALLRLEQQSLRLREETDRIPEMEGELARRQEKLAADRADAATLDSAMDFLARARENLDTAYMGPIRERFAALMARMTGEDPAKILVTPELEVGLERRGQSRALACFSAGQADVVMLCMRLALVDALFRGEKPFVILDDPFVNLDDDSLRDALELLRELGRERQILYLVCHSSRVSPGFDC